MPTKKRAPRAKKPPAITDTTATRARAIRELGIDVPVYRTRVVGGRLELHCYGGQVFLWPAHADRPQGQGTTSPPLSGGTEGGQ